MSRPLTDAESATVARHLPLVQFQLRGLSCDHATWEDLRAAGYLGLCYAIRRYDPAIAKWSVYAKYWVRKFVLREIEARSLIHVPTYHRSNVKGRWNEASKKRHGAAAERIMAARQVSWHDNEMAAVMAVEPPREPEGVDIPAMTRYLHELSERKQTIVRRCVMNGERVVDVAHDLGINRRRVSEHKSRALLHLRLRILEERPEWALP
jgi:RNA polymerase sigma factor (sigma-70 family)